MTEHKLGGLVTLANGITKRVGNLTAEEVTEIFDAVEKPRGVKNDKIQKEAKEGPEV